ncbi:hypothetical protein MKX03_025072 [Papaver bracteatum]|nr:hypothetical protein MKX03_025072 [Papaver bracteatum]
MESIAAEKSPEQFWRSLWSRLSQHRLELKHLFKDWDIMSFDAKEQAFEPYLDLLFRNRLSTSGHHIHKDRSDVNADLETLQKLHNQLERDMVEGKRNRIKRQIAIIYAHKKIGMLLCDLDRINKGEGTIFPDADFRDWIREKLQNEDWEDYLKFVNAEESHVLYAAAVEGVQLEKQTITPENIKVRDVDEVKSRLTVYHKELEAAYNMQQKNLDSVGRAPYYCKLIDEVIPELSRRHLVEPVEKSR